MKILVLKEKLVAALQRKQSEEIARFEREKGLYENAQILARQQYSQNLESYLKTVKAGGEILEDYVLEKRLNRGVDWGTEPKKVNPKLASALARLEIISGDEIPMDEKDEYLSLI